jgi:hypothetical protein
MKRNFFQKGISLVETVFYVAGFSIIGVITMQSIVSTSKAFADLRISRDINDSAVSIMERMTRDIRNATSIDQANSTFGVNPGRLTIATVSATGTPITVEYVVVGSQLHIRQNGVDQGSLLSLKSQVSSLVFYFLNTGRTTGVKIELNVSSSRGAVADTDRFYDTIMLRGSY